MEYRLAIENCPETVPGGSAILLVHPSIGETDRIDTDFLKTDTDHFLVISTRTTAREVQQKLEHYEVDEHKAVILDTLSVDRGYSRRGGDDIHYAAAPDDFDGILATTEAFLRESGGKRRISVDSITEMAYYANERRTRDVVERLIDLLETYDAVGLFHLSKEVYEPEVVEDYVTLFDATIELHDDGSVSTSF